MLLQVTHFFMASYMDFEDGPSGKRNDASAVLERPLAVARTFFGDISSESNCECSSQSMLLCEQLPVTSGRGAWLGCALRFDAICWVINASMLWSSNPSSSSETIATAFLAEE